VPALTKLLSQLAALPSHEAARCANEQGKFWADYDKLFAGLTNSNLDLFKGFSKDVRPDVAAFEKCFDAGRGGSMSDMRGAEKMHSVGRPEDVGKNSEMGRGKSDQISQEQNRRPRCSTRILSFRLNLNRSCPRARTFKTQPKDLII